MSSTENLLTTPLHSWHTANGGRMVDFADWSMPVQYTSILQEHHQTRNSIGLFDVSHMARLYFTGDAVLESLDQLTTRRVSDLKPGRIKYSLICNNDGGILDDVLVYRLSPTDSDPASVMMVVNASNRAKIVDWLGSGMPNVEAINIDDRTPATAMIAVQGPQANTAVASIASSDPGQLKRYGCCHCDIDGVAALVSRTGYTGEDGCEIIVDADNATQVWERLVGLAATAGGGASGLAARDTLRLEAAMPLYGHELNEEHKRRANRSGFRHQSEGPRVHWARRDCRRR